MPRVWSNLLRYTLSAVIIASAAAGAHAQLTAQWSAPVSGQWTQASRWSTAPLAPTSLGDRATLGVQGAPYVVTAQTVAIDRISVASPDATLRVEGGVVSAANGIDVSAGKLELISGAIENTRISGDGAVVVSGNTTSSAILKNVTLAADANVAFPAASLQRFRIDSSLELENATLTVTDTYTEFQGPGQLGGQGTIRFESSGDPLFAKNNYAVGSWVLEPGVDMVFAGGTHRWQPLGQTTGRLINRSNIAVEPGATLQLFSSTSSTYGSFRNEGTITVGEGASLGMRVHTLVGETGGVGNVLLAPNSTFWLGASYIFYIDKPINVPATARLELAGGWVNQSQINLAPGATLRLHDTSGSTNWGAIEASGATVELGYAVPFSRLAQLKTSSATKFVGYNGGGAVALEGKTVNLATRAGIWSLEKLTISGGTLTGLANGGTINLASTLYLTDVRLAAANNIAAGRTVVSGASTIAAPLSLSGGTLSLGGTWKNESVVSGAAGRLKLATWSTSPGTIAMTGGSVQIGFNQNFSQLLTLPVGSPDEFEIGSTVNLQNATINLATLPWDLQVGVADDASGMLQNGVISATNGRALRVEEGTLSNIELLADLDSAGSTTFAGASATVRNASLSGTGISISSTAALLDRVTIDGDVTLSTAGAQVINGLTVDGDLHLETNRVQMTGNQTIGGAGKITTAGFRSTPGGGFIVQNGTLTLAKDLTFLGQRRGSRLETTGGGVVNRGKITVARDDYAATYNDLTGPGLTIKASSFTQTGELSVVTGEELRVEVNDWANDGVVRLAGGKLTAAGTAFRNGPNGEITGPGVIDLAATTFMNLGRVAPGAAVGALTFSGNYAQNALGQLAIELGGTTPGVSHDLLAVTGAATLGGSLKVSFVAGFTPTAGSLFTFLTAQNITGTFSTTTLPTLPARLIWETAYGANSVALRVVLPGDFTGDGRVDGADFLTWQRGGSPRPFAAADLTLWRQNFGVAFPAASTAAATSVPEPASVLCAALGGVALLAQRRPRKS
ncbi:hypothetical protein [Lacipirellula parvula]|uniref:PEP-CTERM protein-sorting domain-containing protein n=1 Tax=Lacipirellula parvula TaxID=2650471 RepID=A0A5K7XAG9_9BACT|nr:hypothetical protein [Lacipirellula parvula]BBO33538.1 hypothetical protein PLANPX_3150 [Lacipirellula parvula]